MKQPPTVTAGLSAGATLAEKTGARRLSFAGDADKHAKKPLSMPLNLRQGDASWSSFTLA